jgi:prevent-host-death family protein
MSEREPATRTVEASEARERWGQLLAEVSRGEARVVVEEGGRPVAAIISARDLERFRLMERQRAERFKALEETWAAFADVSAEEIEREVAKAIAEVRAENHARAQHAPSQP